MLGMFSFWVINTGWYSICVDIFNFSLDYRSLHTHKLTTIFRNFSFFFSLSFFFFYFFQFLLFLFHCSITKTSLLFNSRAGVWLLHVNILFFSYFFRWIIHDLIITHPPDWNSTKLFHAHSAIVSATRNNSRGCTSSTDNWTVNSICYWVFNPPEIQQK